MLTPLRRVPIGNLVPRYLVATQRQSPTSTNLDSSQSYQLPTKTLASIYRLVPARYLGTRLPRYTPYAPSYNSQHTHSALAEANRAASSLSSFWPFLASS